MVARALVISSCEGQGGGLAEGVYQDGIWMHLNPVSMSAMEK